MKNFNNLKGSFVRKTNVSFLSHLILSPRYDVPGLKVQEVIIDVKTSRLMNRRGTEGMTSTFYVYSYRGSCISAIFLIHSIKCISQLFSSVYIISELFTVDIMINTSYIRRLNK